MSATTQFTIQMEDRPRALGKVCRAIADRGINIVAFQSYPESKGKSTVRLVTDNPPTAKMVLENEHLAFTEEEVVQVKLPNRVGALAQAASRLGDANINIEYGYCGLEPSKNTPLIILGVEEVGKAAKLLDQAVAAAAAGTT
jgi:hypothetical protein